ncbi:MAG TPA: hypothetical protein VJX67_09705, partial [Blastocatellia bacterium]|nr:hypothetical protein [Blastocatellia bacterium]
MKTRSNRSIVLLAVLVFLCQGFRASAKSAQERIGTFFYVVLTIKDGRLAVDWNKSYFTSGSGVSPKPAMAKPSFKCPPPISDENLKSLISDYVDRSLSRLPRLYWFGLTADQQKLDTTNSFDVTDLSKLDQAARDIRTYNAKGAPINWADFYQAFNAWAPNGSLLDDAFDNLFPRFIQNNLAPKGMVNISQSTPLTFDNSNGNAYFAPDGVIIFGVSEPVCNWSGNGYQVKLNGVLLANDKNTDGINGLLKSFKNRFWISADITALISDYFLSRGQGVQVRTSEPGAPKTIAIQQVRIAKVRFPYQSQDDDNAANEIMYLLLADPHFRAFLGPAVRGQVLGRQGDLPGFKV